MVASVTNVCCHLAPAHQNRFRFYGGGLTQCPIVKFLQRVLLQAATAYRDSRRTSLTC